MGVSFPHNYVVKDLVEVWSVPSASGEDKLQGESPAMIAITLARKADIYRGFRIFKFVPPTVTLLIPQST